MNIKWIVLWLLHIMTFAISSILRCIIITTHAKQTIRITTSRHHNTWFNVTLWLVLSVGETSLIRQLWHFLFQHPLYVNNADCESWAENGLCYTTIEQNRTVWKSKRKIKLTYAKHCLYFLITAASYFQEKC